MKPKSDHVILKTEDPTTMPLPSMDLLEMHLRRLTAFSGGAEPIDLNLDSDDSGDEGVPKCAVMTRTMDLTRSTANHMTT